MICCLLCYRFLSILIITAVYKNPVNSLNPNPLYKLLNLYSLRTSRYLGLILLWFRAPFICTSFLCIFGRFTWYYLEDRLEVMRRWMNRWIVRVGLDYLFGVIKLDICTNRSLGSIVAQHISDLNQTPENTKIFPKLFSSYSNNPALQNKFELSQQYHPFVVSHFRGDRLDCSRLPGRELGGIKLSVIFGF